jgi:two-component system phosphate regulon sensor histidine kinase PhoR
MEIVSEIEKGSIFKIWFPAKRLVRNKAGSAAHDIRSIPSNKTIPPIP